MDTNQESLQPGGLPRRHSAGESACSCTSASVMVVVLVSGRPFENVEVRREEIVMMEVRSFELALGVGEGLVFVLLCMYPSQYEMDKEQERRGRYR